MIGGSVPRLSQSINLASDSPTREERCCSGPVGSARSPRSAGQGTWCVRKSMVEFRDVSSRMLWSSLRPDERGSSQSVREGDADGPRIGRASSNVNQLRGVIAVVQASTNRPLPAPGWLCRCLCLWKTPARVMKLDISRQARRSG
jgi:hypothetical protein